MVARLSIGLVLVISWTVFSCVGQPQNDGVFRFRCPDQCYCGMFPDHEVQCPRFDPLVKIDFKPPSYVKLQCESTEQDVYNRIPDLNLGEIVTFKMQSCPLPVGRSLASIPERLNTTKIRFFAYQASPHQDNALFRKQHFVGFKDLERLLISDNSQNELPVDMFDEMVNLRWLQLKSNRDHLHPDIFSKLRNVEALELAMNLKQIESGLFASQSKLETLSLWGNQLRNLTKVSFKDVPGVVDLDLSANNIESLEPETFSHLLKLKSLNLNANNFSTLPPNLFANNSELIEVKLLDNRQQLAELPAGLFAHLPKLQRLYIRAQVTQVPEDLIAGSVNLSILFMDRNQLTVIPPKMLQDQVRLEELSLVDNKLMRLDDNLFQSTRALRVLRLSYNHLFNISA